MNPAETVRLAWKCRQCKAFTVADVQRRARHLPGVVLGGYWNPARDVVEYLHEGGQWRSLARVRWCCGNQLFPKGIRAEVKAHIRCGAACQGAKSDKCVCECGGTRHAEAHVGRSLP